MMPRPAEELSGNATGALGGDKCRNLAFLGNLSRDRHPFFLDTSGNG